jgi:integrase
MAGVVRKLQTPLMAKRRDNRPPVRRSNSAMRSREYLVPEEVERMIAAARRGGGRLADRDALLIMLMYRHGLRVSEAIALRWDAADLKGGTLYVSRLKHGSSSTHPLRGPELRAMATWRRHQRDGAPYVFTSLRGGPVTRRTAHNVIAEVARAAGLPLQVHPHMLRHATGYYLAASGQDTRAIQLYLGHKNISHTVRYTEQSPTRFKNFWSD